MPDDLIKTIKELAHRTSEDYILLGKPMNGTLLAVWQEGDVENEEILKRICEQANQNVYLALFHDDIIDNSNIQFDLADFDSVREHIQTSEKAMKDYQTPPDDFRSLLELLVTPASDEGAASDGVKVAELHAMVEYRDAFRKFDSGLETLKTAEAQAAEGAFNQMAHDAKLMVTRGESLGDIAKIAARSVGEMNIDMTKVARAYDLIHRELVHSGFRVKTGFTKVSALRINSNADMLKPAQTFALSIEKVATLEEMRSKIAGILKAFDKVIKSENK